MNVLVLFYSMYGHIKTMAQAAAEGVAQVPGMQAVIKQVPETLPADVLGKMGSPKPVDGWPGIPVADPKELGDYAGIVFCTPTRFGNMCGQMKQFLDATGGLWLKGALVGKPGTVIASSNTQHGGQESTILTTHVVLLHQGMVIVGLPYAWPGLMETASMQGCSPYGASAIAGADGSRGPSELELDGARWQGKYLAEVAKKLGA